MIAAYRWYRFDIEDLEFVGRSVHFLQANEFRYSDLAKQTKSFAAEQFEVEMHCLESVQMELVSVF